MLWKTKLGVAVLLGFVAVLALGTQPAAAAEDNTSTFAYLNSAPSVPYGTVVPVHVETQDDSRSCQTIFDDCDNPEGTIVIYDNGTGRELGRGTLAPVHNNNEVSFVDINLENLAPGFYRLLAFYFGGAGWQNSQYGEIGLTVTKLDCGITLTQDSTQSVQGQQVEFLAAFSPLITNPGTVTFTNQAGTVLGTTDQIFLGLGAKLQTTSLPLGTTSVTASFSGAVYNTCTSNTVSHSVVALVPPTADAGGPYSANEGSSITLSGLGSSPGNGPGSGSLSFAWDYDDGVFDDATGISPTYPAGESGIAGIGLEVTTGGGATDTDFSYVQVFEVSPTVSPTIGGTLKEGSQVTLTGTASDPWDALTATVDWGDGSPVADAKGAPVGDGGLTYALTGSHTYRDNGTYTVKACATDDDGSTTCVDRSVTIDNVAPTLTVTPGTTSFAEGGTASLQVAVADAGAADVLTTEVDWGTGAGFQTVSPGAIQHAYGDNGSFTATVRVTDDDGAATTSTTAITVSNVAPSIELQDDLAVLGAGGQVLIADRSSSGGLSVVVTDPGSDDLTAVWDLGLGAPGADETQTSRNDPAQADPFPSPSVSPRSHTFGAATTFDAPCLYQVSVKVSDDDGGASTSASANVLVQGSSTSPSSVRQWAAVYGMRQPQVEMLGCYLTGVRFLSSTFGEAVTLDTIDQAHSILRPFSQTPRTRLLSALLAGWLNVAGGGWDPDDVAEGSTTVLAMLQAADAVYGNASASSTTLTQHADRIERVIRDW